jgi:hypothetical protein
MDHIILCAYSRCELCICVSSLQSAITLRGGENKEVRFKGKTVSFSFGFYYLYGRSLRNNSLSDSDMEECCRLD